MTDDTVAMDIVGPEVTVLGDLMTRHAGLDATISIADVLGRRVLVATFREGENQRDPTTYAYLVTYRYDMEAGRFIGEATQL